MVKRNGLIIQTQTVRAAYLFILLSLLFPRWTQDAGSSRHHSKLCHVHVLVFLLVTHGPGYLQIPYPHICYKAISSLEKPC